MADASKVSLQLYLRWTGLRYNYFRPILDAQGYVPRNPDVPIRSAARGPDLKDQHPRLLLEQSPYRFIRYVPEVSQFLHGVAVVRIE